MLIICAVIQKLKYTESCLNISLRKCIYKPVGNACNCENIQLNPLTRELNPTEQHSLPRYFTGDFKYHCLLLEKKACLIDLSFRFNEIKFCNLHMNWLIQEIKVHLFL
jgi:hypothetical protein